MKFCIYIYTYVKRVLSIGPVARSCNAKERSLYCYPNYRYVSWLSLSLLHLRIVQHCLYPIDDTMRHHSTRTTIVQGYDICQSSTYGGISMPQFIVAKGHNIWDIPCKRGVSDLGNIYNNALSIKYHNKSWAAEGCLMIFRWSSAQ